MDILYTGPEGWGSEAYPGDAGIDLPIVGEHILSPGEKKDLPTGIKIAIPEGYYGRITGRSSALRKKGVRVYEGIIDAGFRGELFSYVENGTHIAVALTPNDRVAQLIISPIPAFTIQRADTLPPSVRGERGFGSSDGMITLPPEPDIYALPAAPYIYLGGPIDHASEDWRKMWADRMYNQGMRDARIYDPRRACQGLSDPKAIVDRNYEALMAAKVALFVFDGEPGNYGFGSPIEIHWASVAKVPVLIYVPDTSSAGVYMRYYWQKFGAEIYDEKMHRDLFTRIQNLMHGDA